MDIATDTGGTFTDLVIRHDDGRVSVHKAATTPIDPVIGVLDVLSVAAAEFGISRRQLLSAAASFVHGTTHAINAVITGNTARTALVTTRGHRDILIMREGGRPNAFAHDIPYPRPYVPRYLTFEVDERVAADGRVLRRLDEQSVERAIDRLVEERVEAVAVCLLWSIGNGSHERRIREQIRERIPGMPVSLSHELNPVIREYRRASSTCIDASLKPTMSAYLSSLSRRLQREGYSGPLHILTSKGGMQPAHVIAETPIQVLNSGPSMAPVAGKYFAEHAAAVDSGLDTIVADTGGTTYDLSVVRGGNIPITPDLWVGEPFLGHMTGFPSVEITSIGAGGGSVARVDSGGVLYVGPESAGSDPGPVCYRKGGDKPTLTDACVVLGYVDPDYFLGGAVVLDKGSAYRAIEEQIAGRLDISVEDAAAAVVAVATENMVQAIVEVTSHQGVDPSKSVLIGGGGAAGMNSTFIARRLECKRLVIPEIGGTLSAGGASMADMVAEFRSATVVSTESFDMDAANAALASLNAQCTRFVESISSTGNVDVSLTAEAKYANQVWTIDVPLTTGRFSSSADVQRLEADFHAEHQRLFHVVDEDSPIEIVGWAATVRCGDKKDQIGRISNFDDVRSEIRQRPMYFPDHGFVQSPVFPVQDLVQLTVHKGPAVVDSPITTVVVDPTTTFYLDKLGSLILESGVSG